MLQIPISDADIENDRYQVPYDHPGAEAPEVAYAVLRRRELGGFLPDRRNHPAVIPAPTSTTAPSAAPDRSLPPPRWRSSGSCVI